MRNESRKDWKFPTTVFAVFVTLSLHPSVYGRIAAALAGILVAVCWLRRTKGVAKKFALCLTLPVVTFLAFSHISIIINNALEANSVTSFMGDTAYYFREAVVQTCQFIKRLPRLSTGDVDVFEGLKMQYVLPGLTCIGLFIIVLLYAILKHSGPYGREESA